MFNKNIHLDLSTLRLLYATYKEYIIPLIIILFSSLLFLWVVVPQYNEYFAIRSQAAETGKKIAGIQDNIKMLSSADLKSKQQDFETVSFALPSEKDFASVLQTISKSSLNSSVAVGDYSFIVGNLSEKTVSRDSQTSFNLSLTVNGTVENIQKFIDELSKASPVARISDIEMKKNSATINVSFFYKAIPKSLKIDYEKKLPTIDAKGEALIQKLRSWQEGLASQ